MPLHLNIDLGELEDEPEALFALATTVNVACGGHAGDDASMGRAVERARRVGARLLAHPSYPDRAGFGRTTLQLPAAELAASVGAQCGRLDVIAARAGSAVLGVKLHGALYHDAARSPLLAGALVEAITASLGGAMVLVGPPEGALRDAAHAHGFRYEREGFADRAYHADGSLLPRAQPGSVLDDPLAAAQQALRLAHGGSVETLCVHGDNPQALAVARAVRGALERRGLLVPRDGAHALADRPTPGGDSDGS